MAPDARENLPLPVRFWDDEGQLHDGEVAEINGNLAWIENKQGECLAEWERA